MAQGCTHYAMSFLKVPPAGHADVGPACRAGFFRNERIDLSYNQPQGALHVFGTENLLDAR